MEELVQIHADISESGLEQAQENFKYKRNYLMTAEECQSTICKCQNHLQVFPASDSWYGALAEAYIWEQNFTDAREAIGKAIELSNEETHAEWLATQAWIESAEVNNSQAMDLLHKALKHNNCSHKTSNELKTFINLELADLHMVRGENAAAMEHISQAEVYLRNPSFPPRLKAYGAYINARVGLRAKPLELIEKYKSLLHISRESDFKALELKILFHLGQEHLFLAKNQEALPYFESFLQLNRPALRLYQGFTYGAIGHIYYTMRELKKARTYWEKAHLMFSNYFDQDHGLVQNVLEWMRRVDEEA